MNVLDAVFLEDGEEVELLWLGDRRVEINESDHGSKDNMKCCQTTVQVCVFRRPRQRGLWRSLRNYGFQPSTSRRKGSGPGSAGMTQSV